MSTTGPRGGKQTLPRTILAMLAVCLVGACGSGERSSDEGNGIPPMPPAAKTAQQTGGGALAALSVSGATSQSSDPYEGAMECAVALRTLTTELNSYPALASADQKAALDKAKAIYDEFNTLILRSERHVGHIDRD